MRLLLIADCQLPIDFLVLASSRLASESLRPADRQLPIGNWQSFYVAA